MRRVVVCWMALAAALAGCDRDSSESEEEKSESAWPAYAVERTIGDSGDSPGQLRQPLGLDVDEDGTLWVADTGNGRVQRMDADGGNARIVSQGWKRPVDIAVAADGKVWVADLLADRIRCLRKDGSECGRPHGSMPAPAGLDAREGAGPLAVQLYDHRVVSVSGQPELEVGGHGGGPGELSYPTDVAVLPDGRFLVADAYNHRVHTYDPRGRIEKTWTGPGGHPFQVPTGVDVGDDVIHVADGARRRVIALSRSGELLAEWRLTSDRELRIQSPVRVAAHGDRVYVADPAHDRIVVLRRAKRP